MAMLAVGVVILLAYFKLKPLGDRFVLYFNSINWNLIFTVFVIAIIFILIIYFAVKRFLEKRKEETQSKYWANFELRAPARKLETYLEKEPDPFSNYTKLKSEMDETRKFIETVPENIKLESVWGFPHSSAVIGIAAECQFTITLKPKNW